MNNKSKSNLTKKQKQKNRKLLVTHIILIKNLVTVNMQRLCVAIEKLVLKITSNKQLYSTMRGNRQLVKKEK